MTRELCIDPGVSVVPTSRFAIFSQSGSSVGFSVSESWEWALPGPDPLIMRACPTWMRFGFVIETLSLRISATVVENICASFESVSPGRTI